MVDGRIVASGDPGELGGRADRAVEIRFVMPAGQALGDLPDVPGDRRLDGNLVLITTDEPVLATQRITTWAIGRGFVLERFSVSRPTLEDIYLELTGAQNHAPPEAQRR